MYPPGDKPSFHTILHVLSFFLCISCFVVYSMCSRTLNQNKDSVLMAIEPILILFNYLYMYHDCYLQDVVKAVVGSQGTDSEI